MECLVCAKQSVTHETMGSSSNPRANTGAGSVIVSTAVMRKQLRESPVLKCPDPGPLWEVWTPPGRLSFHVHWPTSRECLAFLSGGVFCCFDFSGWILWFSSWWKGVVTEISYSSPVPPLPFLRSTVSLVGSSTVWFWAALSLRFSTFLVLWPFNTVPPWQ